MGQKSPQEVLDITFEETDKYKDSPEVAVKKAADRVQACSAYPQYARHLLEVSLRAISNDYRHHQTENIKRAAGVYGGGAKVVIGPAVAEVCGSIYDMFIGGKTLGSLQGCELGPLQQQEEQLRDGHDANVRFLKKLKPLVPASKTVREAVTEGKLWALLRASKR
jgi:hypothetical protein